jgi:hypothetical protein
MALAAFPGNWRVEETAVQLIVQPMPVPKPALKYQLLPELRELNPGNAAQNYLKCFMEQRRFFYGRQATIDRERYQRLPLAELPVNELRDYGGAALHQADWAARLDTVDWLDLQHVQQGGLEQLPAEAGPLQVLAAALQVRLRAEVAQRRFDDAIRTAKTMFALARHLGENSAEAAQLVGFWVAHLCLDALQEMVQQPGCPNLYWALTDLPCPLVDLRKGVQGERTRAAAELRTLRDDAPMTEADLEKFVSRFCSTLNFARVQAGRSLLDSRRELQSRLKDAEKLQAARRRLVEAGCAETLVNRFPPLQIILLEDKQAYEIERDERLKLLSLPLSQLEDLTGRKAHAGSESGGHAAGLFVTLLPNIIHLRRTQGELELQIAFLRHVEALRLYAAEHDGRLPRSLSDISVPLPVDPSSGKPLGYVADQSTAYLRTPPSSKETNAGHGVQYRVIISTVQRGLATEVLR